MISRTSLKITKDQVWFLFFQGIGALGSLLAGKVIAHYFQPAEFGKYFIATSLVALYTAVIANPIIQSYRHLYYRSKDGKLFVYFRSLFFWQAIVLLVVLVLIGATGITTALVLSLVFLQIVMNNNSSLQMANINIQGHTTLQAKIQGASPFINLALLLGIVYLAGRNDYIGIWWALVLAEVAVVALTIFYFKGHRAIEILPYKLVLDKEVMRVIIRFAKPLMLLPAFAWVVNNLDRYLLDIFYSKTQVGIYSAAYGLSAKIFLIAAGALVALLNASVYQQMTNKDNYMAMYHLTMKRIVNYIGFGLVIVLGLYLFSDVIGLFLLSEEYRASFALIPLLGLANLIFTALFIPEQIMYAIGKTKYILWHYALGAGANLLLNLLLIPRYGAWGAGLAMVLSSIIQLIYLLFLFRNEMSFTSTEE